MRGRGARGPGRAAAGRASPRSSSRRRCGRAVRQEHWIIAEALVAARRPDQRAVDLGLEVLDMAIRPGDAQRGDEMRLALRSARARRAARNLSSTVCMACRKSLSGPAQRAEWMPGAPPSASTASPESSANAGRPDAVAAAARLDARVGAKARAGLLRLGKAKLARRHGLDAVGRQQLAHFARACPGCGSRSRAGRDATRAMRPARPASARSHHRHLLQIDAAWPTPFCARAPAGVEELLLGERHLLGRALHLDDAARRRS